MRDLFPPCVRPEPVEGLLLPDRFDCLSANGIRGSVQTSPKCAVSWKLTAQFPKHDRLLQTIILYGRYIIDGARLRVRANSMAAAAVTPAVASNAARFDVKNHCQLNGLA